MLLAATLMPGRALGVACAPDADPAPAGLDSSSAPVASPGDYTFPSAQDRSRAWVMSALGPPAIAGNLVGAAWRHWATDEPPEWDTDGGGFARRFATGSLTTFTSETSLTLASAAMRQDAGYYRCPRTGFGSRLGHALVMTFAARDRDGDLVFSPGKTLSPFVGPVVTVTTHYPDRYTYADGLVSGAYGLLMNAGLNAAREFVLKAPPWHGGRRPGR